MTKPNIALVEDDYDFRNSISSIIEREQAYQVSSFQSFEDFLEDPKREETDILISDIALPGMNGIEGIRIFHNTYPDAAIMVLSVFSDDQKIFEAIKAGATSYLVKSDVIEQLPDLLKIVSNGGAYLSTSIASKIQQYFQTNKSRKQFDELTERENDVLNLLIDGYKYRNIAETLFISLDTVRYHVKNVYTKLQVHTKDEIITRFR